MSLENCDVGLKFQLKMLKFMESMNQEHKWGKSMRARQDKIFKPHIIQGARFSS
jgi:hypothetical protein